MKKKTYFVAIALCGLFLYWGVRASRPSLEDTPAPQPAPLVVEAPPQIPVTESPKDVTAAMEPMRQRILAPYQTGDYKTSLEEIRRQLRDPELYGNYKTWVQKQLPIVLTSFAWTLLQAGQCEEAVNAFEEALRESPIKEARKGLAVCRMRQQEWDESEKHFYEYLKQVPDDSTMRTLYSDLLESRGEYEKALQVLSTAPLPKPEEEEQMRLREKAMIAKWRESEHQVSARSQRFTITHRPGEHDHLVSMAYETLDLALWELENQWGLALPQVIFEVVFYPSESFSHVTNGPEWAQGVYDGRVRIPINRNFQEGQNLDIFRRILRHEFTHAALDINAGRRPLPVWFQEGIAQLFECESGCRDLIFPAQQGNFLQPQQFEQPFIKRSPQEAKQLYQQSLYLIMTLQYGGLIANSHSPLQLLLANMGSAAKTDTDGLLRLLEIDFSKLHQKAAINWQHRLTY